MTTKLKIDLTQGILEVEGSETFVRTIYRDFKVQFLGEDAVDEPLEPARRRRSGKTKSSTPAKTKQKPAKEGPPQAEAGVESTEPQTEEKVSAGPAYTYIKDLDLSSGADHPSLVEFMDSKLPITNEERNLVFVYYLQQVSSEETITLDHIYTCYRKANIRAPLNLDHSLRVTAGQQGWINIAENGNITVTSAGQRYLEKQLPKKIKS
jgi:hypothetical protein